ncbi:ComEC/Rec2 family competence protein [Oerskovia flava]|uniref:ComEC/Rec2 family competence protein n=1 Tax=Oerskovia flava TaxID=2986422 RepID=UPI0022405701|nr:ComEC/Rec2 family competence protein [Oerskovia sp. JB1-3-2]
MRPPTDLRLVPAAVGTWVCAWLLVARPAAEVVLAAAVAAVCWATIAALVLVRYHRSSAAERARARTSARTRPRRPRGGPRPALAGQGVAQLALVVSCVLAILLSGAVQLQTRTSGGLVEHAAAGASAEVTGVVRSSVVPLRNPWSGEVDRYRVTLAATSVTARGATSGAGAGITVVGDASWAHVAYGSTVRASGRLEPGEAGREAVALLRTTGAPVLVAEPGPGTRVINTIRAGLLDATDGLSPQGRGLVPGVAVGDTSRLPEDLDDAMIVTSLTHVTAVSGSHLAIVVATVAGLCVLLRFPRPLRVAATGLAMIGFVALVHPQPSVLRAACMGAVALVAVLARRPSRSLPALAASVIALLVVDPWLARSFGFALSAAATAGLVLGTGPITRRLEPWCGRAPAYALAVPVAAQLACAPIVVLLDPAVSLYAVPANLVAAPALGPATVLGVLAALVAPVWPAGAGALGWVASVFTWWIAAVAELFAGLPGAKVPWPGGTGGAVLLAALTVVGVVVAARWRWLLRRVGLRAPQPPAVRPDVGTWLRRRRRPGAPAVRSLVLGAVGAGVVLLLVVVVSPQWTRGAAPGGVPTDWTVVACDVGQGDALVVRTGAAAALMVDVGPPTTDAGECLDRLGVRHLDLLVLTHFHADHVGGLDAVLDGRTVDLALVTELEEPESGASRTLRILEDANVRVEAAVPGRRDAVGQVTWDVLWAGPEHAPGAWGPNEASVVVHVDTGELTVVALGDLEDAGQDALVGVLEDRGIAGVDVVKVAHHGSRVQSPTLARRLAPAVAVVSSGENTYGHPADDTLALYEEVGAAVLRTDRCGTFALVARDARLGVAGCG